MADVTGPISTLPGSTHRTPEGMTCDECGKPSTVRVQGETDSFGCEMIDLCDDCFNEHRQQIREQEEAVKDDPAVCEWCNGLTTQGDIREMRDFEEGQSGRLYSVCSKCREKERKALEAELDHHYDCWV